MADDTPAAAPLGVLSTGERREPWSPPSSGPTSSREAISRAHELIGAHVAEHKSRAVAHTRRPGDTPLQRVPQRARFGARRTTAHQGVRPGELTGGGGQLQRRPRCGQPCRCRCGRRRRREISGALNVGVGCDGPHGPVRGDPTGRGRRGRSCLRRRRGEFSSPQSGKIERDRLQSFLAEVRGEGFQHGFAASVFGQRPGLVGALADDEPDEHAVIVARDGVVADLADAFAWKNPVPDRPRSRQNGRS